MKSSYKFRLLIVLQEKGKYYTNLGESYLRAFDKFNINCTYFDLIPASINNAVSRLLTNFSLIEDYIVQKLNNDLFKFIEKEKPNAILVIKGTYLLPDTLRLIKQEYPDILTLCFNPDDPFNSNKGASNKRIRESINLYDIYLIWSRRLVDKLKLHGANEVYYLSFASDPEIVYPLYLSENDRGIYNCDVSFIGNGDPERQNWIDKIGEKIVSDDLHFNFRLYGSNWTKTYGIEYNKSVEGINLLKALSGSKINLNLLRLQNKQSHNMRTFEIPSSGGFMLHERTEEAMDFFEEGKEAEYFSNTDELLDKAKYYLIHENLRKKISRAGVEKIFNLGYTYQDNVKIILGIIDKSLSGLKS